MQEFFKGWRRKAGCVALVMACVAMGMWLRSQFIEEGAGLFVGGRQYAMFSADGELGLSVTATQRKGLQSYWWTRELRHGYYLGWPLVIRYMELAIPLTLLSVSLILWKPRKKNEAVNSTAGTI